MDVILIQPRCMLGRGPTNDTLVPLGLLAIATPLDLAGYKVRIIDQRTDPDWESNLLSELDSKPICVGVTVMTGPSIFWALKASELVKRHSSIPVVWGGTHPSLLPHQTLENPNVDLVVQGEGEETFFELVQCLVNKEPLHQIRGLWHRENGPIEGNPPRPIIDLNMQQPLSYHLIDLKTHMMWLSGRQALLFETSRGCPFNCTFCYNTSVRRGQWRALTANQVLMRLKRVLQEYKIGAVAFSDDNFFVNLDRAHQILEGMVQSNLNIVWGKGDIRLDLLSQLDDDFLDLMQRSGCLSLVIGVESGSQRVANLLRKEIDVSQAVSINRRLVNYAIQPRYLFLVGMPGETELDLRETEELMLTLIKDNPMATVAVQIFVPYPGTELFDLSVQSGLLLPQKLEDWIPFTWLNRGRDYPWLAPDRKRLIRMLSFCSYFAARDNSRTFGHVSPLVTLLGSFYRPIARKRLEHNLCHFFPELKLAELMGFRGR